MKRILFLTFLLLAFKGYSQEDTTMPVYKQFPFVPQFTIAKAPDSTVFTRDDLSKKKDVVMMIFNPECEHCQHEIKAITEHMNDFKKVQFVMISYLGFDQLKKFYSDYHIADYPNIVMGKDNKFFFPVFYKIRNLPSIFLYDKKHQFKKSFEGSVKLEDIISAL
jgi:thiol-disulfide isomerase/thioredoxin